ncbi:MAG: glycoside hydrolase, partial [Sediminibacterium sp.]|nr:glycoside hydrolase [Sediminibacterium sp.]
MNNIKVRSTFITLCLLTLFCNTIFSQVKQVQYLSGTGSDHTVDWDFFCTGGGQSGYWTKIAVPSCWELQGFGNYNYGRDYKT